MNRLTKVYLITKRTKKKMNESTEYSVILLKSIHHFHGVFFTAVNNLMCFRQRRV